MAERGIQHVEKGDYLGLSRAEISCWCWQREKGMRVAKYRVDYKMERENQATS